MRGIVGTLLGAATGLAGLGVGMEGAAQAGIFFASGAAVLAALLVGLRARLTTVGTRTTPRPLSLPRRRGARANRFGLSHLF